MDSHGYFCVFVVNFFTKKYLGPFPSIKTQASQWLPTSCFAAAALSKLGRASVSSDTLTNSPFLINKHEKSRCNEQHAKALQPQEVDLGGHRVQPMTMKS